MLSAETDRYTPGLLRLLNDPMMPPQAGAIPGLDLVEDCAAFRAPVSGRGMIACPRANVLKARLLRIFMDECEYDVRKAD